jgi:dTDP-4-amino-4,6-dideoxygalactose transaminase
MNLREDLIAFIKGKKETNFYFQTLTLSDSLLSIGYAFSQFIGLRKGNKAKRDFLEIIKQDYQYKECFLFGSARSSLYALLKALNYDTGSEILITGFTCEVVPNAIINAGFIPIYIDINLSDYCMDPNQVENAITDKTKAIIIQHTFGIPAQMDKLLKITSKYNLYVIEDCAVSLGSKYKGQLTGTFGDAAIFSFELSKTITSGWGGMLVINSEKENAPYLANEFYHTVPEQKFKQRVKTLLQLGSSGLLYQSRIYILGKYLIAVFFKFKIFSPSTTTEEYNGKIHPNYLVKLSNEQIKVLSRQYKRLTQIIQQKEFFKKKYLKGFSDYLKTEFIELVNKKDVVLIRFPILIENRPKASDWFESNRIELGYWFTAPLSSRAIDHSIYYYKTGCCPNSEYISRRIINLPLIKECDNIISKKALFINK